MGWGINQYALVRMPVKTPCKGYYLRWYYNGWHHWWFLPGTITQVTEGEDYWTLGTRQITMGSGQITAGQCAAIRTIMNTREISILTDVGWMTIRLLPGSVIVYDNQVNGYEIEITALVGSKELSITGFSPIPDVIITPPDPWTPPCAIPCVIGSQIWMSCNYDVNIVGSRVYDDDEGNRTEYGGLYTYDQAIQAGFCPPGWHLPTLAEWMTLINYLGGLTVAAGLLKEEGNAHWTTNVYTPVSPDGCFKAFGGGAYGIAGGLYNWLQIQGYFLTATESTPGFAHAILMNFGDIIAIDTQVRSGIDFCSLRLIKDTPVYIGNGALYNWYAATNAKGIAPTGWHVPSLAELTSLYNYVTYILGYKLMEVNSLYWNDISLATNELGFNGRGSGVRWSLSEFSQLKERLYIWGSDAYNPANGNAFVILNNVDDIGWMPKENGLSIRLIKDSTTLSNGQTGSLTDIDGNVYQTICINGVEWTSSNLKVTHYNDGTSIPNITDNTLWAADTTGAMCYYNNTITSIIEYLLPPIGWHLPTIDEIDTLVTYLGGDLIAGGHLKEAGLNHWNTPNTGADNSSGFTFFGNGWREYNTGMFTGLLAEGDIWSSTEMNITEAMELYILATEASTQHYQSVKSYGFSIRLIKDNSTDSGTVTDFDGNVYPTVKIGTQVWMASNFQGRHFNNGTSIPLVTEDAAWVAMTSEAMCYYGNIIPPTLPTGGKPPQYKIYISEVCSLTYEVFPLNFLSTTLVDELDSGQLFYRRKFNGSLIFGSNSKVKDLDGIWHNRCEDWELFWGFEQTDPCARLYIQINVIRDGIVYPYWDGYFSTTEGKFDIDRQLFEITPTVNDEYSLFLDDADTEYNIIGNTPEVTTTAEDIGGVGIDQAYTHNHFVMAVVRYIANPPGSPATTTVVSTFFETTPNYVTAAANKLTKLTIAQKSDIVRPGSTNPATVAMISWNALMDILKGMFQVYWVYDHLTDTIYLEHISYWDTFDAGLDLRVQPLCVATNKYSYVRDKMPKYEKFSWMEANNFNFIGVPIRYDSDCVNQDNKTNTVETSLPVTTDLEHIYQSPEAIDDDGWVILQNTGAGPYTVEIELAEGSVTTKWNMHLAWSNLHHNYFMHNRVMIEGYINNSFVTFASAQKTRKQECSAIVCLGYDPDDNITTELGETYFGGEKARVDRAVIHPSGEIKFSLVYGTHYHTPAPEPPDKWIRIVMDGCTHFDAQLSEVSAINLYVEFQYVVLPESGPVVCANAAPWDVWTIPATSLTDDYDITLDCAIPSGGCIYYYRVRVFEDAACTILSEYVLDFVYDETCRC